MSEWKDVDSVVIGDGRNRALVHCPGMVMLSGKQ
jgi:hypothetical protein